MRMESEIAIMEVTTILEMAMMMISVHIVNHRKHTTMMILVICQDHRLKDHIKDRLKEWAEENRQNI